MVCWQQEFCHKKRFLNCECVRVLYCAVLLTNSLNKSSFGNFKDLLHNNIERNLVYN